MQQPSGSGAGAPPNAGTAAKQPLQPQQQQNKAPFGPGGQQHHQQQQQQMNQQMMQHHPSSMPGPSNAQPFLQNKVHLWANQGFAVDSGIHSGVSSGTQSVISGRTSIHDELIGNMSSFSSDFATYQEQEGGQMAAAFSDNGQLARAIPEMIKLMQDSDPVIVRNAALTVNMLTKQHQSVQTIVSNSQLVGNVIQVLNQTQDVDTKKHAIGAIYNLSEYREGLDLICAVGGIPAIVSQLYSPVDKIVFYALTCLHNILMHQKNNVNDVRMSGAIEALTRLMDRPQEKVLALISDCLQNMAAQHPQSKLLILQHGGTEKTVAIMRNFNYEKLLYMTARLLKVLSVCDQNKQFIIQAGGMQALQRHLSHPSLRLVKHCMLTLRNLSDAAGNQQGIEELLVSVINLLGSSDPVIVACCTGVLFNMSANNQPNKHTMCQYGGVEGLMRTIISHFNSSAEIAESTLCALRHLTARHDLVTEAQYKLKSFDGGLQVIMDLLVASMQQPSIIKPAIQIFINMATNPEHLPTLRELRSRTAYNNTTMSLIECSATTIQMAINHIRQSQIPGQPAVQNKPMMQLIQVCASLMHAMSRDEMVRHNIRTANIIPLILQLVHSGDVGVQRAACAVLNELAADTESAEIIERDNGLPQLYELTQQVSDEKIHNLCESINERVCDARERAQMQMMAPGLAMFGSSQQQQQQSEDGKDVSNASMNTPPPPQSPPGTFNAHQQLHVQSMSPGGGAQPATSDASLDSPADWMMPVQPPGTPIYTGGVPSPAVATTNRQQPPWNTNNDNMHM